MTRRVARHHGFTLLEVLLAAAVAATLAFALYAGLGVAIKARRSVEATLGVTREAAIVMDLIARDLGSVPPADPQGLVRPLSSPFIVGANTVSGAGSLIDYRTFAPLEADPISPRAIVRVELGLYAEGDGLSLVRRVYPVPTIQRVETPPEEEVLCRGVAGFTVRCYDGTTWYDEWNSDDQGGLPRAVEIVVELGSADPLATQGSGTVRVTRLVPLVCTTL